MKSKKIWIRYLKTEINVDRDLFRNVTDILKDKGLTNLEICDEIKFSRSNFYYIKAIKVGMTNKAVEFVKLACEYIHRKYINEYTFNRDKNCFEKYSPKPDKQLHNGVYYGYFRVPHTDVIDHFIVEVEEQKIKMWSQEKNGFGVLSLDKSTYSINLEAADNANNREFLIGKNSEDPNLKCLIATWRNRSHKIYSVVCLIKFIEHPAFEKWETIEANQVIIKQHLVKNTPEKAKSIFYDDKIKFIHIDNIIL